MEFKIVLKTMMLLFPIYTFGILYFSNNSFATPKKTKYDAHSQLVVLDSWGFFYANVIERTKESLSKINTAGLTENELNNIQKEIVKSSFHKLVNLHKQRLDQNEATELVKFFSSPVAKKYNDLRGILFGDFFNQLGDDIKKEVSARAFEIQHKKETQ